MGGVVGREVYAHFFLFVCPLCGNFLGSVCSSAQRNLEPADSHVFSLACHCGWTGEKSGFAALRHWVELGEHLNLKGVPDSSILLGWAA